MTRQDRKPRVIIYISEDEKGLWKLISDAEDISMSTMLRRAMQEYMRTRGHYDIHDDIELYNALIHD